MSLYEMGKVSALGQDRRHSSLAFEREVRVDEKVDGSQISFGLVADSDFRWQLRVRSRSRYLDLANPDKMFAAAVASIREREHSLVPGWTYLGEYLQKPRHNVLCYERVPLGHVVLFDIVDQLGVFATHDALCSEAIRLGFTVVRSVAMPGDQAVARAVRAGEKFFADSQLGGVAEGAVIKAGLHVSNRVVAKVVADEFKEVKGDPVQRTRQNPDADLATTFANRFCPTARFLKAVQNLREAGEATGTMRDIGPLRKTVSVDLEEECAEQIKDELYAVFRKKILSESLRPLAGWYEQFLRNDNAFWSMLREDGAGALREDTAGAPEDPP